MNHIESKLQIRCVKWFAYEYPSFRTLLFHPKNEGNGSHIQGAIAKAEGVVPGVPDLLLTVPSGAYSLLAIEMKTPTGKQSLQQKQFQTFLESARGKYIIARNYETFVSQVNDYMNHVSIPVVKAVAAAYKTVLADEDKRAKKKLYNLIHHK
jgi:hypothetical protein